MVFGSLNYSQQALQIPLSLQDAKFASFVDQTCNYFKGFYVQRPAAQRAVIHQTYVQFKRFEEDRNNQEYLSILETADRNYTVLYAPNEATEHATRLFEQRKARHLHEIEKELLLRETGSTFASDVQLKITVDTFTRDRWIDIIFSNTIFETEILIPKAKLYPTPDDEAFHKGILFKIRQMETGDIHPQHIPDLFASSLEQARFQEIEERKRVLLKEVHQSERKKILDETCDFALIHSNVGVGGFGSGRTPYGKFTGDAIAHVKKIVQECYLARGLSEGKLHKDKKKVAAISAEERLLMMMNAFVDSYSALQTLRYGDLEQIATRILNNKPTTKQEPIAISPDETQKKQMKGECKSLQKLLSQLPKTTSLTREQLQILDNYALGFFRSVEIAQKAIQDLFTTIEVHLEKDFSEEEREKAKTQSLALPIPSSQPPSLSTSPGRQLFTPGRKNTRTNDPLPAPVQETPRGFRKTSTPFSPRNSIIDSRIDDYRTLKLFHKVLKSPLKLFESIIKVSEKK